MLGFLFKGFYVRIITVAQFINLQIKISQRSETAPPEIRTTEKFAVITLKNELDLP